MLTAANERSLDSNVRDQPQSLLHLHPSDSQSSNIFKLPSLAKANLPVISFPTDADVQLKSVDLTGAKGRREGKQPDKNYEKHGDDTDEMKGKLNDFLRTM